MNSSELTRLIERGLELHRSGKLELAGRIYREALELDPDRATALHLFGLVLYQLGDSRSAVNAIRRAIALKPNQAHFHANLAEVYRSLGQLDLWAGSLVLALRLRPDRFSSPDDYDIVFLRLDELDRVRIPSRKSPEPLTGEAAAEAELAARARLERDHPRALAHWEEAVRLAPGVGWLRSNLSQALVDLNRPTEALAQAESGVRMAPNLAETWKQLGDVLRVLGRSFDARSSYLDALRLAPDMVEALDGVGRLLAEAQLAEDAIAWFRMALEIDPKSAAIRSDLAYAFREMGELEEALAVCQSVIDESPDSYQANLAIGSILHELGRSDESKEAFTRAMAANPLSSVPHQKLGILLSELGDLAGAERSFREILRLPGDHSRAYAGLARIHRGGLPEADLAAIEHELATPDLLPLPRMELNFAAATVYDSRREFDRAAEHLRLANGLQHEQNEQTGRGYRLEDHEDFVERMIEICSQEFFERIAHYGSNDESLVFIFGLPRSGTSLTEQILASHSQVHGLGESDFISRSFERLPDMLGLKSEAVECLARLDRELSRRIAHEHLAKLQPLAGHSSRVVDKMPSNYLSLGWLSAVFPNARFIHCQRDLRDIAVSCWSTNFWYLNWTNRFEDIASRFAAYQRLMNHWEEVLPTPILSINYEETVADVESVARRMVDWCGLDWEPACLDFHTSSRVVRTASVAQVREPIYGRSVERWRNYEAELGPLFDQLEPMVKV